MKVILYPFVKRAFFTPPFLSHLFLSCLCCIAFFSASAKTVVIGSGSGTVSQTSMSGLSAGDVLAIAPGTYSGATFSNLNGITITTNGGTVTFTGSNYFEIGSGNTNLTIIGLNFSNVNNDAFLLTGTNTQGLYIYHCTFSGVTNNIIDVSGYCASYTGTVPTLKVYRFAMDNCKFTNCGQVWQGFYGTPSQNTGLCDSVEMGYDTVMNTATNGTELAGPMSHMNIHHWRIIYVGANPVTGDVGAFQTAGDGQVHDCYMKGGRGYLCRELGYGLNGVGAFYFYNNIIYGQNAYGAIDFRSDSSNYGSTNPYLGKCNAWLYNCTMGNKTDVNGYVCPVAIIGVMASTTGNATCTIRNMFAFNNQYGANSIVNNNSNGQWPGSDTANDVYSDAAHALLYLQDTTTTFMPLANSYLNTNGAAMPTPYLAKPDLWGFSGSTNRIGAIFYNSGGHSVNANAGANQTITLPTNSVSLSGSGSTVSNSTISSYAWSETSGPNTAALSSPNTVSTNATGLIAGTYVFSLKVTDANSDVSTATVTITVNAANQPPVVSAGANQAITLPTNSVTLTGTATDLLGISSYLWTQTSGPNTATIAASNASSTSVTGLIAGTYVFQLTVLDLLDLSSVATVSVTVNPATQVIVSAGSNQSISMPTNSVTLTGTATDASDTITSYLWTQVSGPDTSTITNATSITATATGLIVGTYVFQLKATDNNNLSGTATVSVTVTPSAVDTVSVSAGTNQNITLPSNSVVLTATVTDSKLSNPSFTTWWSQTSGPSASALATPYKAATTATGLIAGTYIYNVSITDPNGTATATVSVIVNPEAKTSAFQSPVEVKQDTASADAVAVSAKSILTDSLALHAVSLYPNPVTGTITFQISNEATGNMMINIYDMSGKMVMLKEYNKASASFITSINVSSLYRGTYILQAIIAKQAAMIIKFVKM